MSYVFNRYLRFAATHEIPMNIKKIKQDGTIRVLKTDSEVLVDAMSSADRVLMLKAKAKASCVVATPEMVEIIKEIARSGELEKTRLDAAKTIVAYGLGTPDVEQTIPHGTYNKEMPNDEIDAILSDNDESKEV